MKMYKKKTWRVFIILLSIYIAGGLILYFIQDKIIFHGRPLPLNYTFHFTHPFKEININADGHRNLNIIQFLPKEKAMGIVLYFHGNMGNIEHYASLALAFTKNNYELWMIDYPGYGKTTGEYSERSMYSDALHFYQLAIKKSAAKNIIIYGKSLGTGVASYLASIEPCKRLILETPYYSMQSMARKYFPIYPSILVHYSFPTYQYLKKVTAPISIFHGTSDEVIPYQQSLKLKQDFAGIELVTISKAKHNNLYTFPQVIKKLDSLLSF